MLTFTLSDNTQNSIFNLSMPARIGPGRFNVARFVQRARENTFGDAYYKRDGRRSKGYKESIRKGFAAARTPES